MRIRYSSHRDALIHQTAKIVMHLGALATSSIQSDIFVQDLGDLASAIKVVDDDVELQEKEAEAAKR